GDLLCRAIAEALGELRVELEDLSLVLALELLVELLSELARADLVEIVEPRRLRNLLGVDGGADVREHVVAAPRRPADDLELGKPLSHPVDHLVDLPLTDDHRRTLHFDSLVVLERDARTDL